MFYLSINFLIIISPHKSLECEKIEMKIFRKKAISNMATIIALLAFPLMVAAGCQPTDSNQSKTPDEVYRAYYEAQKKGLLTDIFKNGLILGDKVRAFKSKDSIREDEESLIKMRGEENEEYKNAIAAMVKRASLIAQCGELVLVSEVINGQKASLVYDRKEICQGDQVIKAGVKIELVNEDGWKITLGGRSIIPEYVPQN